MAKNHIVMYTVSMHRGGAERVMSILANSFAEIGYDVTLVTDIPVKNDGKNYSLLEDIKCVSIESPYKNFFKKNLYRIKRLRRIVKNEKADVILSFLGKKNYRMLISTFGLKCRKCVSVRNDPRREYGDGRLKKWLANRLFSLADICVFQTREAKMFFNRSIQKKSFVIPNPVDEKFFNTERAKKPKNIATVGRLEPQKNHKLLIDAFAMIEDKIGKDKLLIYGAGSLEVPLRNYVRSMGMCNRIVFMGEVNNIEKELAKAKLFVLSSDYEGMPNSLMEAMVVGVPCVSTDCPCGGPRDLLGRHSSMLVKCGDVRGLANAMYESILKSYENRIIDMKKYSRKTVFEMWEAILLKDKGGGR